VLAAPCTEIALDPSPCERQATLVLVCAPDVICGQWICGQRIGDGADGLSPMPTPPTLTLVPSPCEEA
jgi:hypothetical protein